MYIKYTRKLLIFQKFFIAIAKQCDIFVPNSTKRGCDPNEEAQMNAAQKIEERDRLISKRELRVITGVSDQTLHRWERTGRIPPALRGKGMHPRWSEAEVMHALGLQQP
jgi:predicted DNA-binding transcriptional regulator AlpA